MFLDGVIEADGGDGAEYQSGGGAGGSIWIFTYILSGSYMIK